MGKYATLKQRKFVKAYLEGASGTQAVMDTYNVADRNSAKQIAYQNMRSQKVLDLIKDQAGEAMVDQVMIRDELRESKKDYAVRANVNKDILDRAGFAPVEKKDITTDGRPLNFSIDI